MNQEIKGFLCGIGAGLFYALMITFVKLSGDLPSIALVFFRNLICFIALLPLLRQNTIKSTKMHLHFSRSLTGFISLFGFFYAAQHSPVVNAVLFYNMSPLFIPIFAALWLKETLTWQKILLILTGFIGILLIIKPGFSFLQIASVVGISAGIINALTQVTIKKLSLTEKTNTILFYFFTFSLLVSAYPAFKNGFPSHNQLVWIYVSAMGLCAFSFQWLLTKAHSFLPATKVGSTLYSSVAFGGIFGWVFWKHIPDIWTLLGMAIIITASFCMLFEKKKLPLQNTDPV